MHGIAGFSRKKKHPKSVRDPNNPYREVIPSMMENPVHPITLDEAISVLHTKRDALQDVILILEELRGRQ